jgi:hypothetical protein
MAPSLATPAELKPVLSFFKGANIDQKLLFPHEKSK